MAPTPSIGGRTSKDYSVKQIEAFDREHEQLLKNIAPDSFTI